MTKNYSNKISKEEYNNWIAANPKFIQHICKCGMPKMVNFSDYEDRLQETYLLALEAYDKYNPSKGKITTYLFSAIPLLLNSRYRGNELIRLPVYLRWAIERYKKYLDVCEINGAEPDDEGFMKFAKKRFGQDVIDKIKEYAYRNTITCSITEACQIPNNDNVEETLANTLAKDCSKKVFAKIEKILTGRQLEIFKLITSGNNNHADIIKTISNKYNISNQRAYALELSCKNIIDKYIKLHNIEKETLLYD